MQLEVKNGQTIFDIALFAYNDASLAYNLLSENPNITDIGMDITGLTLNYTPVKVQKFEAKENDKKVNKVVTIKAEQNLFDLSLQYFGNVENIYTIIQNNNYLENIISEDFSGNILNFVADKNYINEFYRKGDIKIGTGLIPKDRIVWDGEFDIWDGDFDLKY